MRKTIITIFIILTSLSTHAQIQPSIGGENAALNQLHQQLKVAHDLLKTFPNKEAEQLIKNAEFLEANARSLFEKRRYSQAMVKLTAALNLTNKAINLLSYVPMERIQQQVADLFRQAEQIVPGSGSKEAERLFQEARKNRNSALTSFRHGNYQKSIEQLRVAKFLIERALSLVQGPKGNIQEQINMERTRLQDLWQRTRELTSSCQDQRAIRLLEQAKKQFHSIDQAVKRGDMKLALTLYYNTSRLLLRAIDLCEGRTLSLQDQAIEEIELLNSLISATRERVKTGQNNRTKLIFDKAVRLQDKARQAVEQGHYARALQRISLARTLLNRLWTASLTSNVSERANQELWHLQADIERLKSAETTKKYPRAKALLKGARMSARDAKFYLARGRTVLALESILVGNRFISMLETAANQPITVEGKAVVRRFDTLKKEIQKSKDNPPPQGQSRDFFEAAQKFMGRAEHALANNEFELASQYIQISFDLLQKSRK